MESTGMGVVLVLKNADEDSSLKKSEEMKTTEVDLKKRKKICACVWKIQFLTESLMSWKRAAKTEETTDRRNFVDTNHINNNFFLIGETKVEREKRERVS